MHVQGMSLSHYAFKTETKMASLLKRLQGHTLIVLKGGGGTPWPESASELYRPSDRHLSEKLVRSKPLEIKSGTSLQLICHAF
jgi:hypothetical protein